MRRTKALEALHDYDTARLEQRYPHPERILIAMRLAKDLEACKTLLQGRPLDPIRIDQAELRKAEQRRLVRLDMTAIDQLTAA